MYIATFPIERRAYIHDVGEKRRQGVSKTRVETNFFLSLETCKIRVTFDEYKSWFLPHISNH